MGMRVEFCFSRSEGPAAWAIASATAPGCPLWPFGRGLADVPSHAFIRFRSGTADAIFEAREFSGPEGWRGPLDYAKTAAWVNGHPRRWIRRYDLAPVLVVTPDELLRRCNSRLGLWRYSHGQLVGMYFARRIPWLPIRDDASRVVCSEALVRIADGVPQQGEHPALPRGWCPVAPDRAAPVDVEGGLKGLGLRAA